PVYEGADGTSHVFYPTSGTTKFVSRDFWTLDTDCVITVGTGRGGCITTTNGQHVEFAKSNQYQLDNGVDVIWPLSALIDLFGNQITVDYQQNTGVFGGATGRITQITDSYQRHISFSYSSSCASLSLRPAGCHLDSITATPGTGTGSRTILYSYTNQSSQGASSSGVCSVGGGPDSRYALGARDFLTSVTNGVDFVGYTYDYYYDSYVCQNQFAMKSITYPYGGLTTYTYQARPFWGGCEYVAMPVVVKRPLSGRAVPNTTNGAGAGVWYYNYTPSGAPPPTATNNPSTTYNTDFQTTTVIRPDNNADAYQYYGFGYVQRVGKTNKSN